MEYLKHGLYETDNPEPQESIDIARYVSELIKKYSSGDTESAKVNRGWNYDRD